MEKLTSSRNLSPNFGLATVRYLANWPLKDCYLLLAAALMTVVIAASFMSSSEVSS
jgi:hypothetical protein